MDSKVKAQFKRQVISACAKNYGVEFRELTFLGAWQNFVYGYKKIGRQYIMRVTHHLHRSLENIRDELDFVLYLGRNGVSVSIPILSANNQHIECIRHKENTYVFDVYDRAGYFLKHFMKGYRIHNDLSKEDIEMMPLLLQMRELIVFTGACRGFDMNKLDAYTQRFVDRLSLMNNPLFLDVKKLQLP